MTETDRSDIDNGIWLCQKCAKLVDGDEKEFTIAVLYRMKFEAERRSRLRLVTPPRRQIRTRTSACRNEQPDARSFWMARLEALFGHRGSGKGRAVAELMRELGMKRLEPSYAPEILDAIKCGSVWAVCGRKSDRIADAFLEANRFSRRAGHYVERVFLLPLDRKERDSVARAIEGHLSERMVVCVSHDDSCDEQVRTDWGLPPGFGMTLIGSASAGHDRSRHSPVGVKKVLVHWGGVDGSQDHVGVVLKEPAWVDQFCDMFKAISKVCLVANAAHLGDRTKPMKLGQFRRRHVRY